MKKKSLEKNWTWKSFKDFLESKGVKDFDRIWYIDIDRYSEFDLWFMNKDEKGFELTNYPGYEEEQ